MLRPKRTSSIHVTVLLLASVSPGWSQPAPPELSHATILHLSASGSVQASPDLLVAQMVARATSPSAASAQRLVNGMIAQAMKWSHDLPTGEARAADYSVTPGDEKRTTWIAQQTLELRGPDGPALLDLAGRLQERGLAMEGLQWQLSPVTRRSSYDQAMTEALKELQVRAAAAASTLGLHVDHMQDVRVESGGFRPPRPGPMLAARVMMAPQETRSPEDVTAEVSADVVLQP